MHRDLKPGNIMFGDFGEVYVLDWAIAKVSFCIVPTVYVGRLRDSLSRAERKLFLHAWQLSRLASD